MTQQLSENRRISIPDGRDQATDNDVVLSFTVPAFLCDRVTCFGVEVALM